MTSTEPIEDREAAYGQLPSISRLLAVMRKGKIDSDLTQQLSDVVGMVKTAYAEGVKKPGELTIVIKVEPLTDDQVALSVESRAKGPKLPPESAILYVDEHNRLATDNPFAYRLPLGELEDTAAADLPNFDHETGEIL
ncbi:MAG: hypothetical protein IT195_12420 [Microthrixaceae bacterium]|nr:hypothetical protein [Microthrixaceae bacterium]